MGLSVGHSSCVPGSKILSIVLLVVCVLEGIALFGAFESR